MQNKTLFSLFFHIKLYGAMWNCYVVLCDLNYDIIFLHVLKSTIRFY